MNDTDKAVQAAAAMVRLDPGSEETLSVSKFFRETEDVLLEEQVLDEVGGACC